MSAAALPAVARRRRPRPGRRGRLRSGAYAPTPVAARRRAPAAADPGTATPPRRATGAAVTATNCLQSYAPAGALPARRMPAGSHDGDDPASAAA